MPDINSPMPEAVQIKTQLLKADLDDKIPAKRLGRNLLIATWNIRAFGDLTRKWDTTEEDSPRRSLSSIHYIAEIISRFDIVAVQEVKANIRALRDTLKILGSNWSLILTDVNRGDQGNGERMAYIFDTRRAQLSGLACEIVVPQEWLGKIDEEDLVKQFVRSPYAVSFKSENHTFILLTLHIKYGKGASDRIPELRMIAKWIKNWATSLSAYDQDLIALGDFNIDERGDLLENTFISEGLFIPPALAKAEISRSIFNKDKYYDQIAWFRKNGKDKLSMKFSDGGNYDFVPLLWDEATSSKLQFSYMLSDHYPLWAAFNIR